MAELRWNPLLRTWTMVASNRQQRPFLPKDWCPFCPGSGKVPEQYDVYAYDNDFPALTLQPETPTSQAAGPYKAAENYGKCEVILYSPQHDASLCNLSQSHLVKLIDLLVARQEALSADGRIRYVFPFENRGEEVGVTMPHPHGQIYAYPFVPQKIQVELDSAKAYEQENGHCLFCEMNRTEVDFQERLLYENEAFLAYLPFFTDYPYGVFIVSKAHKQYLTELDAAEREGLADILQYITAGFDRLFERRFPYMMCFHQGPVNTPEYADSDRYFHFHIEFYPPLREVAKMKYYASSEMGAWAACNPLDVEVTARGLRTACQQAREARKGEKK